MADCNERAIFASSPEQSTKFAADGFGVSAAHGLPDGYLVIDDKHVLC
jgi:hypothetical protein